MNFYLLYIIEMDHHDMIDYDRSWLIFSINGLRMESAHWIYGILKQELMA